jgi:hypothetical protein
MMWAKRGMKEEGYNISLIRGELIEYEIEYLK